MAARRIVITGAGAICALGNDRAAIWQALAEGRPAISPITLIDTSKLAFKHAAEVRGYDPAAYFTPPQADHLDRFAQFGMVAAREAVNDSGVQWNDRLRERTAVITGASI